MTIGRIKEFESFFVIDEVGLSPFPSPHTRSMSSLKSSDVSWKCTSKRSRREGSSITAELALISMVCPPLSRSSNYISHLQYGGPFAYIIFSTLIISSQSTSGGTINDPVRLLFWRSYLINMDFCSMHSTALSIASSLWWRMATCRCVFAVTYLSAHSL